MATLTQRIFVSYSRKDYYFAESLAFHLLQANLPAWLDVKNLKPGADWEHQLDDALETACCFVLVLSSNALRSTNVRAEWQRAIQLRIPIVVAQFRAAPLPDELRRASISDFRSGFGRGLRELIALLPLQADAPIHGEPAGRLRIVPRLPPWVAVMTVLMSIPMLIFCALGWFRGDLQTAPAPAAIAILSTMILLLSWLLPVGFLRRRMGMTRLAVSLACLAALYVYQLVRLYLLGPSPLAGDTFGFLKFFRDHTLFTVLLCAIPLAGLAILILLRPEDLLRWCPTGKGWSWYRAAFAPQTSAEIVDVAAAFRQVRDFHLICDAADLPAASRLRDELIGAGAREAADGPGATPVLLISNRTRTAWLNSQADRLKDSVFTIVATGIALPESLAWLWRREWVDFRSWQISRGGAPRLPNVPEAVTRVRLPGPILFTHQLLCAFGALLFVLGASCLPDTVPDTPSPQEFLAMCCFRPGLPLWVYGQAADQENHLRGNLPPVGDFGRYRGNLIRAYISLQFHHHKPHMDSYRGCGGCPVCRAGAFNTNQAANRFLVSIKESTWAAG